MLDPNDPKSIFATDALIAKAKKANPAQPRAKDQVISAEVDPISNQSKVIQKRKAGRPKKAADHRLFSVRIPVRLYTEIGSQLDKEYMETSVRQSVNDLIKVAVERELSFRKIGQRLSDDARFLNMEKELKSVNDRLIDITDSLIHINNSKLINNDVILKIAERLGISIN